MNTKATDISVEVLAGTSVLTFAVKFSSQSFELNVYIPHAQIELLRKVTSTPWASGAIPIGRSAGTSAFWCAEEPGLVAIMVGQDDQTWDFNVQVPATSIDMVLLEAAKYIPAADPA